MTDIRKYIQNIAIFFNICIANCFAKFQTYTLLYSAVSLLGCRYGWRHSHHHLPATFGWSSSSRHMSHLILDTYKVLYFWYWYEVLIDSFDNACPPPTLTHAGPSMAGLILYKSQNIALGTFLDGLRRHTYSVQCILFQKCEMLKISKIWNKQINKKIIDGESYLQPTSFLSL